MHFDVDTFLQALLGDLHPNAVFPARLEVTADRLTVDGDTMSLEDVDKIHVLGLGKAAVSQTEVVEGMFRDVFGARVTEPLAVTKHGHGNSSARIEVLEAAHPICDESSLRAADALIARVRRAAPDDLVVLCLSGGGSALASAPRPPFTLTDEERLARQMLQGGATIAETNLLRREISRIKNGGLLRACGAHRVVTLITSDVPSRDLGLVSSGPTIHRPIDADEVGRIADRYLGDPLRHVIRSQLGDPARVRWLAELRDAAAEKQVLAVAVADYDYLVERARVRLAGLGVRHVQAIAEPFDEAIETGVERHFEPIARLLEAPAPAAVVSGGELPVEVHGEGEGGRNTEFVLRLAHALFVENCLALPEAELRRLRVLSFATDGGDGPTDHAGGWLTLDAVERATRGGLDLPAALARNDSLSYLRAIGCAIRTGPTATNLMDLRIVSRS